MTQLSRCLEPGCAIRFRSGPDRTCAMHAEDGDTLAARMEAFTELAAPPARGDGGDGDGGQAADGHRTNRHGIALR